MMYMIPQSKLTGAQKMTKDVFNIIIVTMITISTADATFQLFFLKLSGALINYDLLICIFPYGTKV